MKNLFEAEARTEVLARLDKINAQSQRQWGTMTVDQMLWHVNRTMSYAMGEYHIAYKGNWFIRTFFKSYVLGEKSFPKARAKTIDEFKATGQYDIETEKNRFRDYVERYEKNQNKKDWPPSALLGTFTGDNWARLDYKHIDHHFKQFGV